MKKTDNFQTSNAEMVTISRLENQVEVLTEALHLACYKQFDASSEKSEDTLAEQLSFLFNEAEVFSAAEKEAEESITIVAAHKRHKKHEYALDSCIVRNRRSTEAERSIKPFVIDRKSFLFANTPKGATSSAVMFSLIQTAIQIVCLPERMKNGAVTFPKNGRTKTRLALGLFIR